MGTRQVRHQSPATMTMASESSRHPGGSIRSRRRRDWTDRRRAAHDCRTPPILRRRRWRPHGFPPQPRTRASAAKSRSEQGWRRCKLQRGRAQGRGGDGVGGVDGGMWPTGRSVGETKTAALATNPGGEIGPLAVLDDDRHDGSEGSTEHPTRALPPAEIDLPGGGTAAAAAKAEA